MRGELFTHYPLSRHTSWRVGGIADQCYKPADLLDLQNFLSQLGPDEPITWLGLGSNVLIRDGGIAGTVIMTANRLSEITGLPDFRLRVEAGVTCAKLAKYCVKYGFEAGVFFAGIPGTVGGALSMNAGAFGGETWQQVVAVELIQRDGKIQTALRSDFVVQYRHVHRRDAPDHAFNFFSAGIFCFPIGNPIKAKTQLQAMLQQRNNTQPIGTYNCGSVFRNPPGDYAARLIEQTGLKGYRHGQAVVSEKHANFILNTGHATAEEIERLIEIIQHKVYEQHGIMLIPEVRIIGRQKE